MNEVKRIEVMNTLIEINNDRIEGYETASKETKDAELKTLFSSLIQTSKKCRQELVDEVQKLDGVPEVGTKTTGKFFRVWMDTKAALTGNNRKSILESCEYGEDVASRTYNKAIRNNQDDLTVDEKTMIGLQYSLIKADHDIVKGLRDTAPAHK